MSNNLKLLLKFKYNVVLRYLLKYTIIFNTIIILY